MEKIAIVTDSSSGLTMAEAKALGIYMHQMMFFVNGKEYREEETLSWPDFYDMLHQEITVSTSQLPPGEITDQWDKLLEEYDSIIHIPMSSALSGSCNTAMSLASAEEYEGRVFVVDAQRISVTQASVAAHAKELADSGQYTAQEIVDILLESKLDNAIFITVDTLRYLRRSGRVSGLAAMAGDVLNIKPMIEIRGGMLEPTEKARGRKKIKKKMDEALRKDYKRLAKKYGEDQLDLYIAHVDCEEEAIAWKYLMETELYPGKKVRIAKLPMNIACHVGPGTIGVGVSYK